VNNRGMPLTARLAIHAAREKAALVIMGRPLPTKLERCERSVNQQAQVGRP